VLPAHECLEPGHAAVGDRDDRLEVRAQLVALDAAALDTVEGML